jgi:hypothetical protein
MKMIHRMGVFRIMDTYMVTDTRTDMDTVMEIFALFISATRVVPLISLCELARPTR